MRREPATHIPDLYKGKQRFVSMRHVAPELLHRVIQSVIRPGSMTLLLGEAGVGKSRLAYEAGRAVIEYFGGKGQLLHFGRPDEMDAIEEGTGQPIVLLADHLTKLADDRLNELSHLLEDPRYRVIATARHPVRSSHPLFSRADLTTIGVSPMTLEESHLFLSLLLGVETIEQQTLRHWFRISSGNRVKSRGVV